MRTERDQDLLESLKLVPQDSRYHAILTPLGSRDCKRVSVDRAYGQPYRFRSAVAWYRFRFLFGQFEIQSVANATALRSVPCRSQPTVFSLVQRDLVGYGRRSRCTGMGFPGRGKTVSFYECRPRTKYHSPMRISGE